MISRKPESISSELITSDISDWVVLPMTEEGGAAALRFMAGKNVESQDLYWDGDTLYFALSGNAKSFGCEPLGVSIAHVFVRAFSPENTAETLQYASLLADAELYDLAMNAEGEIFGNVYLSSEMNEDGNSFHTITINSDDGFSISGYFYTDDSCPDSQAVIRAYAGALTKLVGNIKMDANAKAARSDHDILFSQQQMLEVLMINDTELNNSQIWLNPIEGLEEWSTFIPYTDDSVDLNVNQVFTGHDIYQVEMSLYSPRENRIPYPGLSFRFLARPSLNDIRCHSYSKILFRVEQNATDFLNVLDFEGEEVRTIEVDGMEYQYVSSSNKNQVVRGKEMISIFDHVLLFFNTEKNFAAVTNYFSLNETGVYEKDILKIMDNLVRQTTEDE